MKTIGSFAAAALLALAVPALAQTTTAPKSGATKMSQADCAAAWNKADATKSGNLSSSQAQGVVTNFKAADTNNDGRLSQPEFTAACDKGLVTASAPPTGTGGRGMTGNEPGTSPSTPKAPGSPTPAK